MSENKDWLDEILNDRNIYEKGGYGDYQIDEKYFRQAILTKLDEAIGSDEVFIDIPIVDHTGKEIDRVNNKSYTPIMIARNHLRAEIRQNLGLEKGTK